MPTKITKRKLPGRLPGVSARRVRELSALADRIDREEADELKAKARQAMDQCDRLHHVVQALKAARLEQGMSLADVDARSGIGRANLCRLENMDAPNPTLDTITRYAQAVGKDIKIALANRSATPSGGGRRRRAS